MNSKNKIIYSGSAVTDLGVRIEYSMSQTESKEPIIRIYKHNPNARIFAVYDNICQNISNVKLLDYNADYFCIIAKCKHYNVIKIQKVLVKKHEQERLEFRCTSNNDIKKLGNTFRPEILEAVQKLL